MDLHITILILNVARRSQFTPLTYDPKPLQVGGHLIRGSPSFEADYVFIVGVN
jgi:hypothetical protein